MMFIIVFNEMDKETLLAKGYKLLKQEFESGMVKYVFANNGSKLDFAKENIHAFTTNKLYF